LVLAVISNDEGRLGNILAAVVMDDHVHVLISLFPTATAKQAAQTWKSVSAHAMTRGQGRTSPVWQRGYFDRWMLDQGRIEACARYILMNPRRRWPDVADYPWLLGHRDV
jgi:putative transposase